MSSRVSVCLLALSAAVALSACRAGGFENENDRLRAEVLDLEVDAAALRQRAAELESQLAAAHAVPEDIAPEVRTNTPRCAELTISRLSHVRRNENEGSSTLTLYVEPRDGRGRFVQLTGSMTVNVAVLPATNDARTIGSAALGPAELRDAYRSGFTGTHYTIEIPIERPGDDGIESCTVRVVYTDGWTGQERAVTAAVAMK